MAQVLQRHVPVVLKSCLFSMFAFRFLVLQVGTVPL